MKRIHKFDNGLKVYDYHLLNKQRKRYRINNVHEQDEENIFISLIERLPREATYVNIGSAIGYYPLLARKIRDDLKIHCFEPLPRHLQFFRENIVLNEFSEEDFAIYDLAVGSESGMADFVDASYGSSLTLKPNGKKPKPKSMKKRVKSLLLKCAGVRKEKPTIEVTTVKMNEIHEVTKSEKINFVQMDIQGAEHVVLRSYFSSQRLHQGEEIWSFLIGTHGKQIHEDCKEMFLEADYKIEHDEQDTKNQPDGILVAVRDSTLACNP